MGRTGSDGLSARQRAAEARQRMDADREARDRRIEGAAEVWFQSDEDVETAEAGFKDATAEAQKLIKAAQVIVDRAAAAADKAKGKAVGKLKAEGLSHKQIATLVGVAESEVRRLGKLAPGAAPVISSATRESESPSSDGESEPVSGPVDASAVSPDKQTELVNA